MRCNLIHILRTTSFIKYLVAGGMGFVIDYSALAICFELLEWHYLLSSAIGFIAGLVFVYISSNKWVFEHRRMGNKAVAEFIIFSVIGLIGLGGTVFFMWLFVDICGIYPLISKFATTAIVLMWNYGTRKMILYS